jgi:hypothetical protein
VKNVATSGFHRNSTKTTFPYHALNVKTLTGIDLKKKDKELKDPTDYRPASNSCPVKTLQRDNDAPGPSELTKVCNYINETCNIYHKRHLSERGDNNRHSLSQ